MNLLTDYKKRLSGAITVLVLLALQGCATAPAGVAGVTGDPIDPFENFNRTVFTFNENLDRGVIRPVATVYRDVTPTLVRRGVTNFFSNITDVWSLVNNALQLKPVETTDTLFRVTVNTLWGLGGIFDVAGDMNIPKHSEDFGQTLGYWGVSSGPYVVLPLFGPSTVRDSFGTLVDLNGNLVSNASNVPTRNSLTSLRLVDTRANFLGAGDVLEQAALDKYTFSREIYLQRRRSMMGRDAVEKEERFDLPETDPANAAPAP
ncbi:MAG: VacJ family lipoprotein [Polaromonas sp.]|nr:VacJ family lipoprotein [Polaromonas sp.]